MNEHVVALMLKEIDKYLFTLKNENSIPFQYSNWFYQLKTKSKL